MPADLDSLLAALYVSVDDLARVSPSFCDRVRLLDSTPVPCGSSRATVKRCDLAGWATYGYCASHSRYFWGLRLYLCCAPDGMPVSFCLAPANDPEREVAAAMLDNARRDGLLTGQEIIIGDKGFSGRGFEEIVASMDAMFVRSDRRDERPRFGNLGGVRQWIESINDTLKGQLARGHAGHTPGGVRTRVCHNASSHSPSGTTGCSGKPGSSTLPAATSPHDH